MRSAVVWDITQRQMVVFLCTLGDNLEGLIYRVKQSKKWPLKIESYKLQRNFGKMRKIRNESKSQQISLSSEESIPTFGPTLPSIL